MTGTRSVHLRITGRVQGVGYRAFVEREAASRHLHGWVRNRRDGSVEAIVSGPSEAVEQLIAACRSGPRFAEVSDVVATDTSPPTAAGFEVRPTE